MAMFLREYMLECANKYVSTRVCVSAHACVYLCVGVGLHEYVFVSVCMHMSLCDLM